MQQNCLHLSLIHIFYRGQVDFNNAKKVPDNAKGVPDTIEGLPDNEQEQQIYKYVLENGAITIAKVVELLGVKHRRARAILLDMVEGAYLKDVYKRQGIKRKLREELEWQF